MVFHFITLTIITSIGKLRNGFMTNSTGDRLGEDPPVNQLTVVQYEQTWERLRQMHDMVWQIPSVTAAIDGGLLLVAFRYVRDPILQLVLIAIGLFLTTAMLFALVKHRYFAEAATDSIIAIENEYGMQHVQIATRTIETNYWNPTFPSTYLEEFSAARILMGSMFGSILVLFAVMIYIIVGIF